MGSLFEAVRRGRLASAALRWGFPPAALALELQARAASRMPRSLGLALDGAPNRSQRHPGAWGRGEAHMALNERIASWSGLRRLILHLELWSAFRSM
eukprot:3076600-Pyramimonas_sp.AAC.1